MRNSWTILPPAEASPALLDVTQGNDLIAHLLAQRGLTEPDAARAFLDPQHYTPAPPTTLHGVAEAAAILASTLQADGRILVWGDFDVDGQTSTSLLVAALRQLAGDERVHFHVPNRFSEGHGMRLPVLQEKLADPEFTPDLILTCDTGITDAESIGYAKDQNVRVLVTDHHDLPPELQELAPDFAQVANQPREQVGQSSVRRADAIVNPKLQPHGDPLRTLPGVGVAYKLIQQLFHEMGADGAEQNLLDLVALGIVADVAEQVHDARYLLQLGLQQLRITRRTGLLALMDVARVEPENVDAEAIGFQLGPRMNALGRLEDATVAVELLTTRDPIRAGQLAAKMERLNQERRLLTSQITAVALEMIERDPALLDYNALVLAHPSWHAGIVGIVASRLVEEFGKPAVLLLNPPGEPARGSARSVPGVDIGGAIAACSALLLHHGGHPGAAGLSLNPDNIDRFRRELDRQIERHRAEEIPPGLVIDAQLSLADANMQAAEALQHLAPFGNGNPIPQFLSTGLSVVDERRMGREGEHRRLTVADDNNVQRPVLWFNSGSDMLPDGPLDLVYTLGINAYRGERSLQLNYVASRPAQQAPAMRSVPVAPPVQIYDLRNQADIMAQLPDPNHAIWYAEGTQLHLENIPYSPRRAEIDQSLTGDERLLVIYSAPPAPELLRWLVQTHRPTGIYLVGRLTGEDSLEAVLRNVAGMCKFALARDCRLSLERMAARLGVTQTIIRYSLLWLQYNGQIRLTEWEEDDVVRIEQSKPSGSESSSSPSPEASSPDSRSPNGDTPDSERAHFLASRLQELLAEMRAYRRYFLRAKPDQLGLQVS